MKSGDARGESTIDQLIRELASDDTNIAQDAGRLLEGRVEAIEPLLTQLPTLAPFGKLCAIDVIGSWPLEAARTAADPSVADVLIPLLRDERPTVREWSANVLGWIGATEAVPELEAALQRSKQAGVPADWTEPVTYRGALTALGARDPGIPKGLAALVRTTASLGPCWAAEDLREAIELLAAEGQVVLYFQSWDRADSWVESPFFDVDLSGDWSEVVARARAAAMTAIEGWTPSPESIVTLEWISETDR
jgi:hypothetical protein